LHGTLGRGRLLAALPAIIHKEHVMGEIKNFAGREAMAKIKDIADGQVGMLCTFTADQSMDTRPMATLRIADDGTLWFFSRKDSQENQQIVANPAVQLIYALPNKSEFLALEGTASVSHDQKQIDELWIPTAKAWFPDGKDDPRLTLITVTLNGGRYWDTQHGKMISLAKIAIGAVTGKPMDDGIRGALKV
jgi:general stress protein 26